MLLAGRYVKRIFHAIARLKSTIVFNDVHGVRLCWAILIIRMFTSPIGLIAPQFAQLVFVGQLQANLHRKLSSMNSIGSIYLIRIDETQTHSLPPSTCTQSDCSVCEFFAPFIMFIPAVAILVQNSYLPLPMLSLSVSVHISECGCIFIRRSHELPLISSMFLQTNNVRYKHRSISNDIYVLAYSLYRQPSPESHYEFDIVRYNSLYHCNT